MMFNKLGARVLIAGLALAGVTACGGQDDEVSFDGARQAPAGGGDAYPVVTPGPDPTLEPTVDPYPSPTPTPNPTPTPDAPVVPAGAWDSELVSPAGTSVWLSTRYGSKYLVVDFSGIGCPGCVALADEHNRDPEFARLFDSGVCGFATVVNRSDLSQWAARYRDGFIGQRSYGAKDGISKVASRVGLPLNAIPTVLILDRSQKIVGKGVGEMPSNLSTLCQ